MRFQLHCKGPRAATGCSLQSPRNTVTTSHFLFFIHTGFYHLRGHLAEWTEYPQKRQRPFDARPTTHFVKIRLLHPSGQRYLQLALLLLPPELIKPVPRVVQRRGGERRLLLAGGGWGRGGRLQDPVATSGAAGSASSSASSAASGTASGTARGRDLHLGGRLRLLTAHVELE